MQNEPGMSKLAEAMSKAWPELKNATLNKVNPHFKSRYADLPAIIDAVREPLAKHGMSFAQTTHMTGDGLVLRTTLLHSSGQSISSEYPLPMMLDKPQQMGSALTYARRYSLAAICGIAADEDDDANAAQSVKNGKPITDEQKDELTDMLEASGADRKRFCAHMGVSAIADIPASRFAEAKTALQAKIKQNGATQ
jgi:hypothetical protein